MNIKPFTRLRTWLVGLSTLLIAATGYILVKSQYPKFAEAFLQNQPGSDSAIVTDAQSFGKLAAVTFVVAVLSNRIVLISGISRIILSVQERFRYTLAFTWTVIIVTLLASFINTQRWLSPIDSGEAFVWSLPRILAVVLIGKTIGLVASIAAFGKPEEKQAEPELIDDIYQ